jgi:hypothetical protein
MAANCLGFESVILKLNRVVGRMDVRTQVQV